MKTLVPILSALALVAGVFAGWLGSRARDEAGGAAVRAAALDRRVGVLEAEIERLRAGAGRADPAAADLEGKVEDLSRRAAALEERIAAWSAGAAPGSRGAVHDADGHEGRGSRVATADPALRRIYDDLRKKVMSGTATAEEQQEFWKAVRTEGFVDALLADLEAEVADAPGSADARMELANAYISKLFTVPPGPEMGIWASKAEGQWKEVLQRDENHWSARFALATSYARYPEFLNKTPDAIKEFETVRRVQENLPPEPGHAQTYVELSLLYTRQNQTEKAREVLEAGSRRHPENEAIRKTLESLGR